MPNEADQTAHHQWEVAQCFQIIYQTCLIPHEMGNAKAQIIPPMEGNSSYFSHIPLSIGSGQNIICYMTYFCIPPDAWKVIVIPAYRRAPDLRAMTLCRPDLAH